MKAPAPESTQAPPETLQASCGVVRRPVATSARGLDLCANAAISRVRAERLANVVAAG